jgi:hypothetical protein
MELTMDRKFVPAEYELPEQDAVSKQRWLPVLVALAIVCGATLALVASNETATTVSVPFSH